MVTSETKNCFPDREVRSDDAWSFVGIDVVYTARNCSFCSVINCPSRANLFSALCAIISRSRSTTSFTATDCTRPAERPVLIFFHNTGLSSYQTKRSSTLLACCASIKARSSDLGFFIAFSSAVCVIS